MKYLQRRPLSLARGDGLIGYGQVPCTVTASQHDCRVTSRLHLRLQPGKALLGVALLLPPGVQLEVSADRPDEPEPSRNLLKKFQTLPAVPSKGRG